MKYLAIAVFVLCMAGALVPASAAIADPAKPMSEGRARQAECASEWKAKKSEPGYTAPAKGEGRALWNTFRSECTVRKGGKSKRKA